MGVSPAENEHSRQKEMQTNSQIQGSFVGSTPLVLRELVLKPHRQSSGIRGWGSPLGSQTGKDLYAS